jgi:hypothetical protein
MLSTELVLPIRTEFDRNYGKWDIAPTIMGRGEYDGELGYLLAYKPTEKLYMVTWDDILNDRYEWIKVKDFNIIAGMVR